MEHLKSNKWESVMKGEEEFESKSDSIARVWLLQQDMGLCRQINGGWQGLALVEQSCQ